MAIDFPTSPTVGQQYTFGGVTYVFTSQGVWATAGASAVAIIGAAPQGRLTLQTGVPVMTATQAAKTTIFYTPYVGNKLPIYDGTSMTMTTFAELSVSTTDTTKSPAAIGASKVNDWFVWNDGGTVRIGHGPDWTSDTARSAGTALTMVNGIWLNNAAITNGPAASRGTYVGTTRSNGSSSLDWILGGSASGGLAGWLGVWNCYNRAYSVAKSNDNGAQYTYTSSTVRQARGSSANQISFVVGLVEDAVEIVYMAQIVLANVLNDFAYWGIGFDTITAFTARGYISTSGSSGQGIAGAISYFSGDHSIGWHYASALEGSDGTSTTTFGSPAGFNSFNLTIRA